MDQSQENISVTCRRCFRIRYIKMVIITLVGIVLYFTIIYSLIRLIIYPITSNQKHSTPDKNNYS